jgi:uncharacterized OB-fold protein
LSRPVAEGVYARAVDPRLPTAHRIADAKALFPAARAGSTEGYERIEIDPEGLIGSYTVRRFAPKPPRRQREAEGPDPREQSRRHSVGDVKIPGQVIVESHLPSPDSSTSNVGPPVRPTVVPSCGDASGESAMNYLRSRVNLGPTGPKSVVDEQR